MEVTTLHEDKSRRARAHRHEYGTSTVQYEGLYSRTSRTRGTLALATTGGYGWCRLVGVAVWRGRKGASRPGGDVPLVQIRLAGTWTCPEPGS